MRLPPRAPTQRSSPPSSWSDRGPSGAVRYAAAMAAYERAAALSDLRAQRAALTLAAARNAWAWGQTAQSRAMLARHARKPTTRCCSATSRGCAVASRSTSARPPTPTGSSSRPPTPSTSRPLPRPRDGRRGSHHGHLRRRQRHHPAGRRHRHRRHCGDSPRTACLKQMLMAMTRAARATGRRGRALDGALATGAEVDDLDVLGNLGNAALQLGDDQAQQRFYSLALSRARDAGAGDGGRLRAPTTVLRLPRRRGLGRRAQRRRGGTGAGREHGTARADRSPAGLAGLARGAPGPGRLRRPARRSRGGRRRPPPRHPDRPGARPDPVGQRARAAAPATTVGALHHLARLRLPRSRGCPLPNASRPPYARTSLDLARGWTDEIAAFAESHGAAVGTGDSRLRSRDDQRPEADGARRSSRRRWRSTPGRIGPSTRRAPTSPTASGFAATNGASMPVSTCGTRWRHSTTCMPNPRARATEELRASGETARKRDPPPW